jgi:hypothetical protein
MIALEPSFAPEIPIPRLVHEDDADHTIAQAALGLTAYLAEPRHWAEGAAREVLKHFIRAVPAGALVNLATSTADEWRPAGLDDHEAIADALAPISVAVPVRHLFWMKLADDIGAPSLGFFYSEVDPGRADRSAVIELTFPADSDPAMLVGFAKLLAEAGPVHSIIGGLAFRWDDRYRRHAFYQIHAWASRYLAVDVQVCEELAWRTPRALPGTNWLNYVSADVAGATILDLDELADQPYAHGTRAERVGDGVLLLAGDRPMQGDLNRLRFPFAYCETARVLERGYEQDPPRFWGPFNLGDDTLLWFRRFLEPDGWTNREVDIG